MRLMRFGSNGSAALGHEFLKVGGDFAENVLNEPFPNRPPIRSASALRPSGVPA